MAIEQLGLPTTGAMVALARRRTVSAIAGCPATRHREHRCTRKEATVKTKMNFVRHPLLPLLLVFLTQVPSLDAQVRFRMATLAPRGTSYHRLLQAMGEEWRKAPGGGVAL